MGLSISRGARRFCRAFVVIAALGGLACCGLSGPGTRQVSESSAGDGLTFSGAVAGGRFTGHGRLEFADGAVYEGGFYAGRFDGEGVLTTADGHRFIGTFRNGEVVTGDFVDLAASGQ